MYQVFIWSYVLFPDACIFFQVRILKSLARGLWCHRQLLLIRCNNPLKKNQRESMVDSIVGNKASKHTTVNVLRLSYCNCSSYYIFSCKIRHFKCVVKLNISPSETSSDLLETSLKFSWQQHGSSLPISSSGCFSTS